MAKAPTGKKKRSFCPKKDGKRRSAGAAGRGPRRAMSITMVDCEYQRGGKKGQTTGRAFLKVIFDKSLNADFKTAVKSVSFLGDVRYKNDDDCSWHIGVTAPRMFECWMQQLPDSNAFKRAAAEQTVEVSAGYEAPKIVVVERDDGTVVLDCDPVNALYHHRTVLSSGDAPLFEYTRNVGDIEGYDRQVSCEAMDADAAIEVLNENGFDLTKDDVATWKEE